MECILIAFPPFVLPYFYGRFPYLHVFNASNILVQNIIQVMKSLYVIGMVGVIDHKFCINDNRKGCK